MTEEERKKLEKYRELEVTINTKGWEHIVAYVLARGTGLKNEIAGIDLTKDVGKAMKKQGIIRGMNGVINWVGNTMTEGKMIEDKELDKKKKEKSNG